MSSTKQHLTLHGKFLITIFECANTVTSVNNCYKLKSILHSTFIFNVLIALLNTILPVKAFV